MKICEHVHQIKIDFNVTPEIARYVYVYLIEGRTGCWLIDSGVAGAHRAIFSYMEKIGRNPGEIRALFLTHSHPDHIGSARALREAAGCSVYGPEAERGWIEDIGQQFRERPIPNFYKLAGESVGLDCGFKGRERLRLEAEQDRAGLEAGQGAMSLEKGITLSVIETGGHSRGSLSYLFEEEGVLFTGDAIPVEGDIPIYVSLKDSVASLERLRQLWPVEICCPAWDRVYRGEEGLDRIDGAVRLLGRIKESVAWARAYKEIRQADSAEAVDFNPRQPLPDWQTLACRRLGLDQLAENPLFRTSLQCTETDDPEI